MLQRVMIIDDDEDDRDFFTYAIHEINRGIEVVHCKSGSEALMHLKDESTWQPQIVFLDVNMPGLDGKETLIRLRQIEALQDIPIVIYSTSASGAADLIRLGASHVLVKPYRLTSMVEEISGILSLYNR
jgi:CheY-like chemotaxis protein